MTLPPEPTLHVAVPDDETDLRVQTAPAKVLLTHGPITTGEFIKLAAGLYTARIAKPLPISFVKPVNEG
jgi:hypothetical protein